MCDNYILCSKSDIFRFIPLLADARFVADVSSRSPRANNSSTRCQRYRAVHRLRPHKAATVETLGIQRQTSISGFRSGGPVPEYQILTRDQARVSGVFFSSPDYLSLANHPALREAAVDAIARWGVHSPGSIVGQGGTTPLLALEERLAEILCCREIGIFPTGWAAGYGVVRALIRQQDHVVIDPLVHDCLQEGAVAATRRVHRNLHCSHEAVQARLERIRAHDPTSGILVVTQSLFPLDSSVPDLRAIQDACRIYNATLLVDISQDFGASGDGGLGFVGGQGLVGEIDILVGSFSKTLASNGGFVASRVSGLRQALHTYAGTYQYSNTLSPVQASVILAALGVIRSREGALRRRNLMMEHFAFARRAEEPSI